MVVPLPCFVYTNDQICVSFKQVFTKPYIERLFGRISQAAVQEQHSIMMILKYIVDKYPKRLLPFFPQLCDDHLFASELLTTRMGIIRAVGDSEEVRT